jgi:predicted transcriptional regulator
MGHEAIKLELIEWLMHLDDSDTINYLKIMKDSSSDHSDWWEELDDVQKQGINRGLEDIDFGRFTSHENVKIKYEL